MRPVTRQRALFAALAGGASMRAARFSEPLGINLYTVRNALPKEPRKTLETLASIGFRELEARPADLTAHGALMKECGLQPAHMTIDAAVVTGAWDACQAWMENNAARLKMAAPKNLPRPSLKLIELAVKHGATETSI
jgi:hypothetical protein